jgi:hypothetical protein
MRDCHQVSIYALAQRSARPPTGGGKTVEFAYITADAAKGNREKAQRRSVVRHEYDRATPRSAGQLHPATDHNPMRRAKIR